MFSPGYTPPTPDVSWDWQQMNRHYTSDIHTHIHFTYLTALSIYGTSVVAGRQSSRTSIGSKRFMVT